jgi:hypothetical protein
MKKWYSLWLTLQKKKLFLSSTMSKPRINSRMGIILEAFKGNITSILLISLDLLRGKPRLVSALKFQKPCISSQEK